MRVIVMEGVDISKSFLLFEDVENNFSKFDHPPLISIPNPHRMIHQRNKYFNN